MIKKSTNSVSRDGRITDLLVFLSNIGFLIFLDPLLKTSSVLSAFFGGLMMATFFLYPIGAYLKKPHVQNRLRAQGAGGFKLPWWFGLLLVFQFVIFAFLILIGPSQFGLFDTMKDLPPWTVFFTVIILPAIAPGITAGAVFYYHEPHTYAAWRLKRLTEIIGDILLTFSIMVFTAIWGKTFAGAFNGYAEGNFLVALLILLFSALPFAMFYLAPRMLYLAEDYRKPVTWVTILLAVSPLAWRILYG